MIRGGTNQGRANQALEQTRDSVVRYGEPVGRELLNFVVRYRACAAMEFFVHDTYFIVSPVVIAAAGVFAAVVIGLYLLRRRK